MSKLLTSNDLLQILDTKKDIISIHIKNNHSLAKISGIFDENFSTLEKLSKTKINLRGNLITIKGNKKDSEIVVRTIENLLKKSFEKNDFEEDDIISFYNLQSRDFYKNDQINKDEFIDNNFYY